MNSDDYKKVEQVLQQQITTTTTPNKKVMTRKVESWHNTLDSINSAQCSTPNRRNSTDSAGDEEFYSMSDYSSLPPLGQPPKLSSGCLTGDNTGFSGFSPEKSLTNISLGGSSSLLSTMSSPPKGSLYFSTYLIHVAMYMFDLFISLFI